MSEQEINLAIADACGRNGWWCPQCKKLVPEESLGYQCRHANCTESARQAPNYVGDLNAMAEAEETLTDEQLVTMHDRLGCIIVGQSAMKNYMARDRWVWRGTARQRAEAFLRTLGIRR
jgi:hypothetical protein